MALRPARTRKEHLQRLTALKNERSTWDAHHRDVGDSLYPRRVRLDRSERNKGTKRNEKIIDASGTYALRTLEAGLMAGLTSPARPWFRLLCPGPGLMKRADVRRWLNGLEEQIRISFHRSNVYNSLALVYRDLAAWGVSVMLVEEDWRDVLRTYTFPIGSYCLANDSRGRVDTVYRETSMTVWQAAGKFGTGAGSAAFRERVKRKEWDGWVDLVHVIEPRAAADPSRLDAKHMEWASVWLELAGDDATPPIGESGYDQFPCCCPRWEVNGEDVYGISPGMQTLPDVRMLQTLQRRRLSILAKLADPPLNAPAALEKRRGATLLPGEVNWLDPEDAGQGVAPMYIPDSRLAFLREEITDVRERIRVGFFADLFRLLSEYEGPQQTAREVAEKHEEKVFLLGPMLDQTHDELLKPLIDRAVWISWRAGLIPPVPEALAGVPVKVEFISPLALAQKLLGVAGVERFLSITGNLAAVFPEAPDKVNVDAVIDDYADMIGVPARMVRSDEEVAAIRERRRQAEAAAQMASLAKPASDAANAAQTLSQTDVGGTPALQRLLGATLPQTQVPTITPPGG